MIGRCWYSAHKGSSARGKRHARGICNPGQLPTAGHSSFYCSIKTASCAWSECTFSKPCTAVSPCKSQERCSERMCHFQLPILTSTPPHTSRPLPTWWTNNPFQSRSTPVSDGSVRYQRSPPLLHHLVWSCLYGGSSDRYTVAADNASLGCMLLVGGVRG